MAPTQPTRKRLNVWMLRITTLALSLAAGYYYLSWRESTESPDSVMQDTALAQPSNDRKALSPNQLYDRAWSLIKNTFYDQNALNQQDWSRWKRRYEGKLKTPEDSHKAIETMFASLGDPYTRFLNEEAFGEERSNIRAELFGVGMQLGMNKEHKVVVIAPIQNTPASRAGIHPGDEIVEVDKKPVKGQSLDEVVKQIRGPKDTKVEITILRASKKEQMHMTRAEIPIKAIASCEILPGNIGYVRLDSFISQKANDEMKDALRKVANCKGLILDLRNNPGGLLTNAVEIANMFLDRGIIVSTIDAEGYKASQVASRGSFKTEQPTVVLINGGSASASEILSGALKDNHRAKLVGQKSFGKGLVQAVNSLGNGTGANVTIARYLTPNDTDIHKSGISPDYEVKIGDAEFKAGKGPWWIDPNMSTFTGKPQDGKDAQLNKAVEVMNKLVSSSPSVTSWGAQKK
ncbi:MAG: S41 family peptidase [Candidatus Obscuribacterales bacterium]|nr:S41 family peptidase [Candidatus Obscuribacterales bacterium]